MKNEVKQGWGKVEKRSWVGFAASKPAQPEPGCGSPGLGWFTGDERQPPAFSGHSGQWGWSAAGGGTYLPLQLAASPCLWAFLMRDSLCSLVTCSVHFNEWVRGQTQFERGIAALSAGWRALKGCSHILEDKKRKDGSYFRLAKRRSEGRKEGFY